MGQDRILLRSVLATIYETEMYFLFSSSPPTLSMALILERKKSSNMFRGFSAHSFLCKMFTVSIKDANNYLWYFKCIFEI